MNTKESIRKLDPSGIYLVDQDGELSWLSTPFNALSICDVGIVDAHITVTIHEVGRTEQNEVMFIIDGHSYHYSYFTIQI